MKAKDAAGYLLHLLNPVNQIIPKKGKQVVFYSNLGFRDNVKAVYDYMIENNLNNQYRIICSCNDYKKYRTNKIKNVKFVNLFIGILYFMSSKYFFYSFGKYPILPSKEQIVVNLWHGSPLKTIGTYNKKEKEKKQDYFTYILAASPFFVPIMAQSFGVDENRVLLCGHGRNDYLFQISLEMNIKFKTDHFSKIVLWLPTFRKQSGNVSNSDEIQNETKLAIFNTWETLSELNNYLKFVNMLCIIKLHPLQGWSSQNRTNYSNIIFFTHQEFAKQNLDLYKVLPIADALITDYSSVYFDYLLLNRPIAFTIDDLSIYSDTRGFIFDNPLEYMPGCKIQDKNDFFTFINDCVSNKDIYQEERSKINDICNYYKDGNNCKRILEKVNIINLGEKS